MELIKTLIVTIRAASEHEANRQFAKVSEAVQNASAFTSGPHGDPIVTTVRLE